MMEKASRLLSAMMREVRTSQLSDTLQQNTSSLKSPHQAH